MSLKNSSDTIGNRTRDLLVCSVVSCKVHPRKYKDCDSAELYVKIQFVRLILGYKNVSANAM
jgi:hypothetical protein